MKDNGMVAILDVGSSKVVAALGEKSVNGLIRYKVRFSQQHESLFDNKIINDVEESKTLKSAVKSVLRGVTESANVKIRELFIGVPGEYISVVNRPGKIVFNKKRKITESDVEQFFSAAQDGVRIPGGEFIEKSAMYFNAGAGRVANPVGISSDVLSGTATFFFMNAEVKKLIEQSIAPFNVETVHFVPSPLAESLFLFSEADRSHYQILLDVGETVSSFSVVFGGGVLYNGSFWMGGSFITGYLLRELNSRRKIKIDYNTAEKIKRKINLGLKPEETDGFGESYVIYEGDEVSDCFDVNFCNQVAKYVLDGMASYIDNHIKKCPLPLENQSSVFISLTGGGISYVRGAKEYLSKRLERRVGIVAPPIPFLDKPENSSEYSLLNYALNYPKPKKKRLFRFF